MTFRRVLDAEVKEAKRMGATLKTNGEEKEDANNEEEEEEKELFLLSNVSRKADQISCS